MEARNHELIVFLQEDLAISTDAIRLALQRCEHSPTLLPMVLWQYGLVTLTQLDRIFDWLEGTTSIAALLT